MKWHWSDGTSESRFKRAPFFGDLPGALGRHTVSRAGNGQAVLRDYWEYPAFLVHDAYTMHPDGFVDRRGFQRRGIVRSEAPWVDCLRAIAVGSPALSRLVRHPK